MSYHLDVGVEQGDDMSQQDLLKIWAEEASPGGSGFSRARASVPSQLHTLFQNADRCQDSPTSHLSSVVARCIEGKECFGRPSPEQ